jgi:hypothetical protein
MGSWSIQGRIIAQSSQRERQRSLSSAVFWLAFPERSRVAFIYAEMRCGTSGHFFADVPTRDAAAMGTAVYDDPADHHEREAQPHKNTDSLALHG